MSKLVLPGIAATFVALYVISRKRKSETEPISTGERDTYPHGDVLEE